MGAAILPQSDTRPGPSANRNHHHHQVIPIPIPSRHEPEPEPKEAPVGWLDLPNKDQLFILAVCRLSEPLSNVCLLPYVFYLVRSVLASEHQQTTASARTDVAPGLDVESAAQVSTYSGILVAAFPLAQFLVSLPWGWLSDAHGRKFSIVIGIAISVVSNAAFGFSTSFGALLFWRTLAGLANGNVGIMRTMTAEVVRERRFQTKAFLLLPLLFNAGMVFSLAFGGVLAEPVVSLPWLFGPGGLLNWSGDEKGVGWARAYPYALPALMNASMLAVALILAVFWMRETLPEKEDESDWGVMIGQKVTCFVKRVVLGRRETKYAPLGTEDLLSDTPQSLSSPQVELDEAKTFETVTVNETRPPQQARSKPPLRSILTRPTIAALVSFGLLPLHNSAFMV